MLHHDRRPERTKTAGEDRKSDRDARKETRVGDAQAVRGTKKDDER